MPKAAKVFGGPRKETRKSAYERGYDAGHRARRLECLRKAEYACAVCGRLASVADHVIPHRGNKALLESEENLQALCTQHHAEKTARGE
jgi:5-methylcytosine-specific restriction protein A